MYAASLSQFARLNPDGSERAPNLAEWQQILTQGELVTPRDRTPTPPDATGSIIYGRVAGVARGSQWRANLGNPHLTIPEPGQAFSYGISTLRGGMQGTGQIQTAPMLVRYPDTAYAAHGNYGIHYNLALPLHNPTNRSQTVTIKLQTPLKEDRLSAGGLRFLDPPRPSSLLPRYSTGTLSQRARKPPNPLRPLGTTKRSTGRTPSHPKFGWRRFAKRSFQESRFG